MKNTPLLILITVVTAIILNLSSLTPLASAQETSGKIHIQFYQAIKQSFKKKYDRETGLELPPREQPAQIVPATQFDLRYSDSNEMIAHSDRFIDSVYFSEENNTYIILNFKRGKMTLQIADFDQASTLKRLLQTHSDLTLHFPNKGQGLDAVLSYYKGAIKHLGNPAPIWIEFPGKDPIPLNLYLKDVSKSADDWYLQLLKDQVADFEEALADRKKRIKAFKDH